MDENAEPLTSESELEEGEISSDDIEIVSEVIKCGDICSSSISRSYATNEHLRNVNVKDQRRLSGTRVRKSPVNYSRSYQNVDLHNSMKCHMSRSPSRKRLNQRSPSNPRTGNRKRLKIQTVQRPNAIKHRKPSIESNSDKLDATKNSESSAPQKWKNSFEEISNSIETESIVSLSDTEDEEMLLRLEALNSVVVNSKQKLQNNTSSIKPLPTRSPTPETKECEPKQEEDDEDEELLRAQLLIEVARKQTVELESKIQSDTKKEMVEIEAKPSKGGPKSTLMSIPIPKADPLVIDLRNDSSDSDDDENVMADSITALLKSARQTVEQQDSSLPQALTHLPRHQQEEYQRLKQEILRRETLRSQKNNLTPNAPKESENIPGKENKSDALPVANTVPDPANEKTSGNTTKENQLKTSSPSVADPRVTVLRQQLVHKKRDLSQTKCALQQQLELVDQHRNLWLKSTQEVTRLKQMLQQAEETELQLRNQLTKSQQHTQRLKVKLQSVERNITLLQNGLRVQRTKRSPLKIRTKSWINIRSSNSTSFSSPSYTFKVKPRILAKALAKTNSTFTYHKPVIGLTVKNVVHLQTKKTLKGKQKKTVHDEQWLFGTLGDDWNDVPSVNSEALSFSWPSGHFTKSLGDQVRVDPSRFVCRYDLDSSCQDMNCPYQHLPNNSTSSVAIPSSTSVRLASLAILQLGNF